ncbi:MAG: flagellar biosynthesis protein FlhF [Planctomycetes bacterium]|nr:flagellar biosynthesis protein FlhF [Planctomycetota bacterium]
MAIKRFTAESWEDALRQVREEFGDSAVILQSKSFKEGGVMGVGQRSIVEVTASNDPEVMRQSETSKSISQSAEGGEQDYSRLLQKAYAIQSAKAKEAEDSRATSQRRSPATNTGSGLVSLSPKTRKDESETEKIASLLADVSELKALVAHLAKGREQSTLSDATPQLSALYSRLIEEDLSEENAREVIVGVNRLLSGAELDSEELIERAAERVISEAIPIAESIEVRSGATSVVAMIGPTGVGKTTTLSKLAANLMLKDHRAVGFITIDTYRLGATEQLRTLAGVLDVPMRVVMSPGEIRSTIRELDDRDIIFIDTAGRSHRDRMKMNELKTFLDAAAPQEVHLCVSATTHPRHLESVLDHFGSLAVDRLVLTKLDEAASFGPVFDVVKSAGLPLSYLTVGQDIPDDIERANGMRLARLMLGRESIEQ